MRPREKQNRPLSIDIFSVGLLSGYNRNIWLLIIASALFTGAYLGMRDLLNALYVLRLGYGPEFVGTVTGVGALSFALSSLPGGALGGRFGVRRMMIIGVLINMLGMVFTPLAESIPETIRYYWLLFAQAFAASGWSIFVVNQIPALTGFTHPRNRQNAFALKEGAAGLGMFVGALVGGMLPGGFAGLLGFTTAQAGPYRHGLYVAMGLALMGLVPLALLDPVQRIPRSEDSGSAALPPLVPVGLLILCAFCGNGAVASYKAFASAYMDLEFSLPTSLIGTITSVGMFLACLAALSSSRLARRRGSGHTMMIASLMLGGNLLLVSLVPHWTAAGLGAIGTLALSALWRPAYQVLQMEMAEPEQRSLISGVGAMAMSLGYSTVSFGGGYVAATVGYRRLFLVGTGLAIASAIVMALLLRRVKKEETEKVVSDDVVGNLPLSHKRKRKMGTSEPS
ncbi:MAG: MFS transporter [Anaerolineales bacterium]